MKKQSSHVGSSLNSFLEEEGILEEARAIAWKEALAWKTQQVKREKNASEGENKPSVLL